MSLMIAIAVGFLLAFIVVMAVEGTRPFAEVYGASLVNTTHRPVNTIHRIAERVRVIRSAGAGSDGIHMLRIPVKIGEDDYLLMGCDNSSAKRNHPDVPRANREEGRWFAGASDLKPRFGNMHGTIGRDGVERVDSFYTTLPRPEYQADPLEVAWHYIRVKQLRALGMPEAERIATMTAEAKNKPWANPARTMIGDQSPQSPGAMPETNPASGKEGET